MKIKIENYSKKIKKKYVLKNINYQFDSGYIYGLHGHNGSGKTMLLRAIAGLIYSNEGKIYVDKMELGKDISFLPSVGIIIENTKLLPEYTGIDNLKILNEINNILSEEQLMDVLRKVGLDPDDKRIVKKYSLGMNQKLVIAQAIMEEPDVLLLDEPTNGLDDEAIELFRKLILDLKDRGSLIIIASHNKEDIRLLADKVLKIKEGELNEIEKDSL